MLKKCLDCVKNIKLDKAVRYSRAEGSGQQGCEEGLHTGYCCSAACKGLRDENNKCCTGKRRGYFG